MEGESQDPRCNVIYYCASCQDDIAALYHTHSPPKAAPDGTYNDDALDLIYHNARILLDQDQGGFHEVFVSSSEQQCLERLELYANKAPTVILIEVYDSSSDNNNNNNNNNTTNTKPAWKDGSKFLDFVKTNIQGARYQKEVLPFAVVVTSLRSSKRDLLDASTTARFLQAGAEEIVCSPLTTKGINRLVGHVMDKTRPPARLVGSAMAQNLVNSIRDSSPNSPPCHRPDQYLPDERLTFVENAVLRWAFPAHELDMDELTYACILMLEHVLRDERMEQYHLSRAELVAFVLATRRQYKHEREVHYHNWRHAVDVTQSIYQFLIFIGLCPPADPHKASSGKQRSSVELLLSPLDGLMLLVSAIGHDVGHPGVNNAFLVACNHPLAQLYNDKSVLENYHCAAYFQLLRRHWPALHRHPPFRQTLISNILATDMQRHFEYMSHLTELRQKLVESDMSVEHWIQKDKDHARELMMALMMKAADISNIARPFEISASWAKILINEFASQGELESELDIPTCLFGGPPDKEDLLAAAQSQKGFMNLFGVPLFQGLSDMVPSISSSVETLERNQKMWDQRIADEVERRKNHDSGHATFESLGTAHDTVVLKRHRQSEPTMVPFNAESPPTTPVRRQPGQRQSGSPVQHPASDERKRLVTGFVPRDDSKRASAPSSGPSSLLIAPSTATSRRSSKDVALDQLHQLSLFANQNLGSASRRGSSEAAFQMHQSYPPSRRGSKDESLTTILVTSKGNTGRTSPDNKSNRESPLSGSPVRGSVTRKTQHPVQKQSAVRNSAPSSHSHAASSGTTTTGGTQHSPSTQPSSVAPVDDDDEETNPTIQPLSSSQIVNVDPFLARSPSPSQADSAATTSTPEAPASTPFVLGSSGGKDDTSPRIISRISTGDSMENNGSSSTPRLSEPGSLRESRSRSRLRSLKFWKKKKDSTSTEASQDVASSP